jgi:hypothetical protein
MMNRRTFLAGGVSIVAVPLVAEAQPAEKMPRIALVYSTSPVTMMLGSEPSHPHMRAFLQRLRELGYVEGQNIVIERRSAEGRFERFSADDDVCSSAFSSSGSKRTYSSLAISYPPHRLFVRHDAMDRALQAGGGRRNMFWSAHFPATYPDLRARACARAAGPPPARQLIHGRSRPPPRAVVLVCSPDRAASAPSSDRPCRPRPCRAMVQQGLRRAGKRG